MSEEMDFKIPIIDEMDFIENLITIEKMELIKEINDLKLKNSFQEQLDNLEQKLTLILEYLNITIESED